MNLTTNGMNNQAYVKQVQATNEGLLVNKIYDTTVCKLLLYYKNLMRYLINTWCVNCMYNILLCGPGEVSIKVILDQ